MEGLLIPLGFFATIAYVLVELTGRLSDGRTRRKLIESGASPELVASLVAGVAVDAPLGRAWVGGVITRNSSTHPSLQGAIHQVGRDVWFRVLLANSDGLQWPTELDEAAIERSPFARVFLAAFVTR